MIRIKLIGNNAPGRRYGQVLDEDGNVIGSAHDSTYGGGAFAVHTPGYAGYTPLTSIEFVNDKQTKPERP